MNCLVGTEKTSARDVSVALDDQSQGQLTVQFFQGELLGLSDKAEDHEPGNKVEPSIETD